MRRFIEGIVPLRSGSGMIEIKPFLMAYIYNKLSLSLYLIFALMNLNLSSNLLKVKLYFEKITSGWCLRPRVWVPLASTSRSASLSMWARGGFGRWRPAHHRSGSSSFGFGLICRSCWCRWRWFVGRQVASRTSWTGLMSVSNQFSSQFPLTSQETHTATSNYRITTKGSPQTAITSLPTKLAY